MSEKNKQRFGEARQEWRLNEQAVTNYFVTIRNLLDNVKVERGAGNNPIPLDFPDKLDDLKVVRELGGSTGAKLVEDGSGNRYVMKRGASASAAHLLNETQADAFYTAFGANVPAFKVYGVDSDKPVKLSRYIEGSKSLHDWWEHADEKEREEMRTKLRQSFAVDVLLGNWDVVGAVGDNILIDSDGQPWRVDNGGALKYRAQGKEKTAEQWSETCFVDELWTMTGNGKKIGATVSSTIPQYFGKVDVLKIAEEVDSLRTATEMKEALSRLSEENRRALAKRLEETRQLAVRGRDMIDAGHTAEYTDEILRLSYEMSKDGLREAVGDKKIGNVDFTGIEKAFPGEVIDPDYDRRSPDYSKLKSHLGAFMSENGISLELGGKEYKSVTEYVASKMTPIAFKEIEDVNDAQGENSYKPKAVERKFAVLKSMGYDIDSYRDWDEMEQALSNDGFWTAKGSKYENQYPKTFVAVRANHSLFEACCEGQKVMDAAIQLVLENVDFPGNDRSDRSMILFRTEDNGVATGQEGENVGQKRTSYRPGVCESYGHLNITQVGGRSGGKDLIVTRVPYSRIHALWFMEAGQFDQNGNYRKYVDANGIMSDFQFWAGFQNEIDACAVDLPIIYVGRVNRYDSVKKQPKMKDVRDALLKWEKKNPKQS